MIKLYTTLRCVPALRTVHTGLFHSLSAASGAFQDCDRDDTSIEIRACRTHEELDECVRLQQHVWKFDDLDTVPRRAFLVTTNIGGVVLGAYQSRITQPSLMGFLWVLPGRCHEAKGGVCLHGEMIGVHPDVANRRIGQRLMLAMRDYAISQDINLFIGNFDPTDSKLAHFYFDRLGCIGRRYTVDYYGQSSSPLHQTLTTDRLHIEFWIDSSHTQQQRDLYKKHLSSELEHVDEVRLPVEMSVWKHSGDARAAKTQADIRNKLMTAFKQGLAIFGFRREPDSTGIYQLGYYTLIKQAKTNQKHLLNRQ